MGLLGRTIFRETITGTFLGTLLFTFVLFLRSTSQWFELLVRSSAELSTVAYLFALSLPLALIFTLPIGVLVGTLLALTRMSSDGEITAMRASGLPSLRVTQPVVILSFVAVVATAACSLWLSPWSIRESLRVANGLGAEQLTADIEPRVFQEQFPDRVLFVDDVVPGTVVRWKRVFMADVRPSFQRRTGAQEAGEGPLITVASEAIAVPDAAHNRIQLSMTEGSSYEAGKDPVQYRTSTTPRGDQMLEAQPPSEQRARRPFQQTDTIPLMRLARDSVDARIELHQRLALPPACLLLALVGIPLGVTSRKAGKSAALVTTVFLAFLYWTSLISLINLARHGTLPVELAVWTPNAVLAALGLFLLVRLERPGDRDVVGGISGWFEGGYRRLRAIPLPVSFGRRPAGKMRSVPLLPQVLDRYVLSSFLLYFCLFLVSFVLMTEVFTFFELLSDIVKNKIPMARVLTYLFFLAPKLIYDSAPVSAMVAVLVTFGVMTKYNEVTAFKSCGVSLHRLAVPVLLTGLALSAALFAFDYYYVPQANRKQDALRAEIKGRPVQTYLRPDRKWISGQGSRIYYYKYFDPAGVMVGVNVYELDPVSFRLRRHISAERANWSQSLRTWVFENGWRRDLNGAQPGKYETYQATTFPELNELPGYFLREVRQEKQLNFSELADYVAELGQSGLDTTRLRIQYYRKFSVPLFTFILAMISVPFAFLTGTRGALAGVGVSFGIAIAYWSVSQLFEQLGNINQLPPPAAAWAPDAVFFLAAMYLLARMRT
jgi:LPS export ABC transporter permease LptG/LPS export ABC transporter permease LptF